MPLVDRTGPLTRQDTNLQKQSTPRIAVHLTAVWHLVLAFRYLGARYLLPTPDHDAPIMCCLSNILAVSFLPAMTEAAVTKTHSTTSAAKQAVIECGVYEIHDRSYSMAMCVSPDYRIHLCGRSSSQDCEHRRTINLSYLVCTF